MTAGQGQALFENRMAAKLGATFDPTIILTILAALLPLLQGCMKPTPATLRRRLGNRVRLTVAIRRQDPSISPTDAVTLADHCFDLADKATDEEAHGFIADCCG